MSNLLTQKALYISFSILFCLVFSTSTFVNALDKEVVAKKQGFELTTQHILAFFEYLEVFEGMSEDPSEEEIHHGTEYAKESFKKNPELFLKQMNEILEVPDELIINQEEKEIVAKNSDLQQEAEKLFSQYELDYDSSDVSSFFNSLKGLKFTNLTSKTRSSGTFYMTTDIRVDINFCDSGKLYMVDYAESAGGGDSSSFLSGSDGGEISLNASWGIAKLPNQYFILMLKVNTSPLQLLPIITDGVNLQLDNKVFSPAGRTKC